MKKVFKLVFLFSFSLVLFSCNPNDEPEPEVLRDYYLQYLVDLNDIENYLKSHYIESVTNNPGQPDDQDIKITKIPDGGTQVSIWEQTQYPLSFVEVVRNNFTYKVYYLKTREGSGPTSQSPCNYDSVLAAYKGSLLNGTVFETNNTPQSYFNLASVIIGWKELFPKFKTGSYVGNTNGTVSYFDFGAGVFFIPSGLAYFNVSRTNIPAYSPLIFSVKLYEIIRVDNDGDGILTYQEDLNGDGYLTSADDTDLDGTPNYIDIDDDGDSFLTRKETEYTLNGTKYYYPYNGALVDDPTTPQNETLGIPSCGTSPDYTSPTRLRKHLDPTCH